MTLEEIRMRRLAGQYLLEQEVTRTVVTELCGVQAQYMSHAMHALKIRCGAVETKGLVKSWTNRGTLHLFAEEDLPLFLHEGRTHFLRPVDTMDDDAYISSKRKQYFADLIVGLVNKGVDEREALKEACAAAGMTEAEEKSLFDPWGGIIRALCEAGRLCQKVQEKKAYRLCPGFVPMDADTAWLEKARRYFSHFGPATVRDAAYFFGVTQARVKRWLDRLPVDAAEFDGRTYFYLQMDMPERECPECVYLAGFDQLMLGYDKKESLMLKPKNMRDVFTASGIVRPVVLLHSEAAGIWNMKNGMLQIRLFGPYDRKTTDEAAGRLWPGLRKIEYM